MFRRRRTRCLRTDAAHGDLGLALVHLPAADLLTPAGQPKPASDLWGLISKAGVPRYAEIVVFADDPGEAAISYFVLRLMGYPDVKLWLR